MSSLALLSPSVSAPSWPVTGAAVLEMRSQRPAHASMFAPAQEAELHPRLRQLAAKLPGAHRGVLVCAEFVGPSGVPDLVALIADPAVVNTRLAADVPALLAEHDCRLVAAATRWLRREDLVHAAGMGGEQAERHVRRLIRVGALVASGDRLRRHPQLGPMGRLWALEAKVDDWRAGLMQAHRYRLWADGAMLLLQRATVPDELLAVEADHYRVGVHVGSRWVRRPRVVAVDPVRRLWASEHLVAAVRGR